MNNSIFKTKKIGSLEMGLLGGLLLGIVAAIADTFLGFPVDVFASYVVFGSIVCILIIISCIIFSSYRNKGK